MKPGYYIDMMDDLVIIYPNGAYEVYNIHLEDFIISFIKLEDRSGKFIVEYIGKL